MVSTVIRINPYAAVGLFGQNKLMQDNAKIQGFKLVFKNLCILMLQTKVASALEGSLHDVISVQYAYIGRTL